MYIIVLIFFFSPEKKFVKIAIKEPLPNIPGKLRFVMDKAALAKWRYPSPNDKSYVHTKFTENLTERSPLISIDCEMVSKE